jgi:steroid delta-isomerase-like uncharacterized protein
MKKIAFLFFATGLFIACQQKGPERYATAAPEIDLIKAHVKDYNDGNWAAWTAVYADTAKVYHNTLTPASPLEVQEGLKANLEAASSYNLGGDDQFYEMVIDDDGEKWVNSWATWKGTLAGNGKELIIPVHSTYQFVGDKIVKEHAYYDLSGFMAMMQEIEAMKNMPEVEAAALGSQDAVVQAWNKNDHDAFNAISAKNFVRNANGVTIAKNQKEYTDMMQMFHSAFPDFKVKLDKYFMKDGKSYINWTVTGTNNGEFMGNPATGKKIMTHGYSVWSFDKEGKVTQEDAFFDNMELYNQLGYTVSAPK